jgi:hypothetical protein
VRDHDKQALAYLYYENESGRRSSAKLVTRDEAFLLAVNIAKLPSVPRQILKDIPRPPNSASRVIEAYPAYFDLSSRSRALAAFSQVLAINSMAFLSSSRVSFLANSRHSSACFLNSATVRMTAAYSLDTRNQR